GVSRREESLPCWSLVVGRRSFVAGAAQQHLGNAEGVARRARWDAIRGSYNSLSLDGPSNYRSPGSRTSARHAARRGGKALMRVLIAGHSLGEIGGVQRYERDLASWLLACGHSPVVY